jgi:hypothetical protein
MKDFEFPFDSKAKLSTLVCLVAINILSVNASLLAPDSREVALQSTDLSNESESRELFDKEKLNEKINTIISSAVQASLSSNGGPVFKFEKCELAKNDENVLFPKMNLTTSEQGVTFEFYHCPISILSAIKLDLYYRVKQTGDKGSHGGEVVVFLQKQMADQSHEAEFVMKSVLKRGKGTEDDTLEFGNQLTTKLTEIFKHIQMPTITDFNTKIAKLFESLLVFAQPKSSTEPTVTSIKALMDEKKYPIRKMVCVKKVIDTPSDECKVEKQTLFEMTVEPLDLEGGMASIIVQLGAIHFRAKVPMVGVSTDDQSRLEEVMKEVSDGISDWIKNSQEKDYQLVELNQAEFIIINAFNKQTNNTSSCYKATPNPVDFEQSNYFTISAKRQDEHGSCKQSEQVKLPDNVDISFFSYQFGYLAYGQLYLDSEFQSAEFLFDLNEESFKDTVPKEITTYLDEIRITNADSKTTIEPLTIESISKYIMEKMPGQVTSKAVVVPKQEVVPKQGVDKNPKVTDRLNLVFSGSPEKVVVKISEIQNNGFYFKVRFLYPKTKPTNGAAVLTTQIVLQKFNTFNQLVRLNSSIEEMKKQLGIQ